MKTVKKYQKIAYAKRAGCMVCGAKLPRPIIDLPDFPITEIYTNKPVKEKVGYVDQSFHFCARCGHGQITNVLDLDLQYGSLDNYHFRTSASASAKEATDFFISYFNQLTKGEKFGTIVEIGCNDMYLLRALGDRAKKMIGIDPILKGREKEFSGQNISAIGDFFENVRLKEKIDVVICKDTLEHVSDPKAMVKKTIDHASDETVFFFQFPLLDALLAGCRFDQVYHQHLNYFSHQSIAYLLNELQCELLGYTVNLHHFGSIIIAFKKNKKARNRSSQPKLTAADVLARYAIFKSNMAATSQRLDCLEDEIVYGYGAALMLPVLSYHLKNDFSRLKCIIDDDKSKEGLYYINLPVPIRTREGITNLRDSIILITAISVMNNVRKLLPLIFGLNPKQVILPLNSI